MSRRIPIGMGLVFAGLWTLWGAAGQAVAQPAGNTAGSYRYLAPGVMKAIDPEAQVEETFALHDVVELTADDAKWEWAKDISFHRDIWHLDFQFKPVRYVWIDMPQPSGKMQRKLVRYLVYAVTNPGKVMHPVANADQTFDVQYVDKPVRFIPEFLLEGELGGKTLVYPDRVIPLAMAPIATREDPRRKFYTSTDISVTEIAPGETRWGVATWIDVEPRITKFSIYVQGLTNAYHWQDDPAEVKSGAPLGSGRSLSRKTLQLNFWRAGDEFNEHEDEVHYGYPGMVDYEWVYR